MPFADTPVATFVFIAAALVVAGLLMFRGQRMLARQSRPRPSLAPAPRSPTAKPPASGLPGDLGQWEVEVHELTRSLSAQLDSKMGLLQQLIREADRAAARLETAITAARDAAHDSLCDPLPDVPASPAAEPPLGPPPAASDAPAEDAAPPAEASPPGSTPRRFDDIYLLADYGYPVAEIAQRSGLPLGEVELILSLRGRG